MTLKTEHMHELVTEAILLLAGWEVGGDGDHGTDGDVAGGLGDLNTRGVIVIAKAKIKG